MTTNLKRAPQLAAHAEKPRFVTASVDTITDVVHFDMQLWRGAWTNATATATGTAVRDRGAGTTCVHGQVQFGLRAYGDWLMGVVGLDVILFGLVFALVRDLPGLLLAALTVALASGFILLTGMRYFASRNELLDFIYRALERDEDE